MPAGGGVVDGVGTLPLAGRVDLIVESSRACSFEEGEVGEVGLDSLDEGMGVLESVQELDREVIFPGDGSEEEVTDSSEVVDIDVKIGGEVGRADIGISQLVLDRDELVEPCQQRNHMLDLLLVKGGGVLSEGKGLKGSERHCCRVVLGIGSTGKVLRFVSPALSSFYTL